MKSLAPSRPPTTPPGWLAPFPPQECRRLLDAAMSPAGTWFSRAPYIGRWDATSLAIWQRPAGRDSFPPELKVTFQEVPSGTLVRTRPASNIFLYCFLTLWLGVVGCLALFISIPALIEIASAPAVQPNQLAAFTPLFMLAVGVVIGCLKIGGAPARHAEIEAFLRQTLQAVDLPPAPIPLSPPIPPPLPPSHQRP